MVRNLYVAGEITQNDVEQYAYFTNQIVEEIKKEKNKCSYDLKYLNIH